MDLSKYIKIDKNSRIPLYRQIAGSVIENISLGNLKMDEKIPSINAFSKQFSVSRDTVEKAYKILKEQKIITPIHGMGYYIAKTKMTSTIKVLFLINKVSTYKMEIYNSFVEKLGDGYQTDFHIYHCDDTLFLNLMEMNINKFDYYVIMPHFKIQNFQHISFAEESIKAINRIPKKKLIIMDNNELNIAGNIIEIYQDFENDIQDALKEGWNKIMKYKKLALVVPKNPLYPYPKRILVGFRKFCDEASIDFEILDGTCGDIKKSKGNLFITLDELDMVSLINQIRDNQLILGKDIGLISYNDTPLKKLLQITAISTDFRLMGETAANMILNKKKGKIKNPFSFIERKSI